VERDGGSCDRRATSRNCSTTNRCCCAAGWWLTWLVELLCVAARVGVATKAHQIAMRTAASQPTSRSSADVRSRRHAASRSPCILRSSRSCSAFGSFRNLHTHTQARTFSLQVSLSGRHAR
jgi:hypothetical protein